jgi:hypothetical protein
MNEIQKLLDAASDPTSKNHLSLENVKRWLVEYVAMRAEETAHFPIESNATHWDLIAADYDSSTDAQFIAALFFGERVTFLAGRGPATEIRAFAQDAFPDDPDVVLDDMARRFDTGKRWTCRADEVIAWAQQVGRGY